MKLNRHDGIGFVVAAVLTTSPLIAATWFQDGMSKDGPIGFPIYVLPALVGLLLAAVASAAATAVGRNSTDRLELHVSFGLFASMAGFASLCCGWGPWWFEYAGRFR